MWLGGGNADLHQNPISQLPLRQVGEQEIHLAVGVIWIPPHHGQIWLALREPHVVDQAVLVQIDLREIEKVTIEVE